MLKTWPLFSWISVVTGQASWTKWGVRSPPLHPYIMIVTQWQAHNALGICLQYEQITLSAISAWLHNSDSGNNTTIVNKYSGKDAEHWLMHSIHTYKSGHIETLSYMKIHPVITELYCTFTELYIYRTWGHTTWPQTRGDFRCTGLLRFTYRTKCMATM